MEGSTPENSPKMSAPISLSAAPPVRLLLLLTVLQSVLFACVNKQSEVYSKAKTNKSSTPTTAHFSRKKEELSWVGFEPTPHLKLFFPLLSCQVPSTSLPSSGRYSVCRLSGCTTVLREATVSLRPTTAWETEEEEEKGRRKWQTKVS